VVFGMTKEAIKLGGVDQVVALNQIASVIMQVK
jgi:chemotaxis response regulator CheB